MRITAEGLSWAASGTPVVRGVDLDVAPGETVGLLGPNGSGKSSLLRCLAGLRAPDAGTVRYDGRTVHDWSARKIARRIAFVEQDSGPGTDLRVADVVGLGRTPFRDSLRGPDATDRAVVAAALDRVGLTALAGRSWKGLSGGERQRAHIARALAQQPYGLLLDEPTNHLDVRHQLELMELLAGTPQTVLVALHDLTLAARHCDRLLLMHRGRLIASGTPAAVLTPEHLARIFEVDAELATDSLGRLSVSYRGPLRATALPSAPAPAPEPLPVLRQGTS
ncbi:sugar ABC transporter substrate-binding protein [Streptomyces nojiriensis]|uniref:Sugar ABC transporter substrate-binding protein n=1 Tax=Streptomyces nojiriensis TaxID=66374 RepID=A0ABQ3SF38_9ACTN|nr:ABC transporter ATP-binding protein [Streptomyces nojiriensis]QTI48400.1 Fe(3+) dicitrate transport ATP-binding protein FecE [Streptomyces nojiriensis]GGS02454.1 sugar ABC transporter substrate-binding protein [Streptomyces nojiriensis]GHI66756.1 sugar ABC transporter substrate-binding protein [Streptomyces nojiriensis]